MQRDTGINTSTYSKEANRVLFFCKKTAGTGLVYRCFYYSFFFKFDIQSKHMYTHKRAQSFLLITGYASTNLLLCIPVYMFDYFFPGPRTACLSFHPDSVRGTQ